MGRNKTCENYDTLKVAFPLVSISSFRFQFAFPAFSSSLTHYKSEKLAPPLSFKVREMVYSLIDYT